MPHINKIDWRLTDWLRYNLAHVQNNLLFMKLPQQQTKQVCVKLATYADNVALPALACCCCSNQSISPATGPTANLQQGVCCCGPMLEKNTQTDVRTPHRFIDPILHAMWAHTHTHPFNGPFSGTTWVSRYQSQKHWRHAMWAVLIKRG